MLILSRRQGETIRIGSDIEITVLEVNGDQVRIGINAPREVPLLRGELVTEVQAQNRLAAEGAARRRPGHIRPVRVGEATDVERPQHA